MSAWGSWWAKDRGTPASEHLIGYLQTLLEASAGRRTLVGSTGSGDEEAPRVAVSLEWGPPGVSISPADPPPNSLSIRLQSFQWGQGHGSTPLAMPGDLADGQD